MTTTTIAKEEKQEIIVIKQEYENFVQPQTPAEYRAMKESIKQDGQLVKGVKNQNNVLIDGHHRYKACKELGIPFKCETRYFENEIAELEYIHDVNAKRRHWNEFQRAEQALKFKDELAKKAKENKVLAGKGIALTNVGKTPINVQEELARGAGVSKGTLYKVEHILNSDLFKQNEKFREDCRTQKKKPDNAFKQVKDLEDGNKPEDIPLTHWAKRLEGLSDKERFDAFGKGIYQNRQPVKYNHWLFQRTDDRLGLQDHPGRLAGQIVMNFLTRWTKQGDLVVDPFCGGGSTIDSCIVMNRRCLGYDLVSRRPDIKQWNITKGFPDECKGCDAIFLDPPYWNMKINDYAKLSKDSISSLPYPDFLKAMEKLAKDCYDTLKEGGHVGLIMQDFVDDKMVRGEYNDVTFDCVMRFRKYFKEVRRIGTPITTHSKTALDVCRIYEGRGELLDINRDLTIFKKVEKKNEEEASKN